jgi:hypothetical protein
MQAAMIEMQKQVESMAAMIQQQQRADDATVQAGEAPIPSDTPRPTPVPKAPPEAAQVGQDSPIPPGVPTAPPAVTPPPMPPMPDTSMGGMPSDTPADAGEVTKDGPMVPKQGWPERQPIVCTRSTVS